jgi:pilus assembly protein CpaB
MKLGIVILLILGLVAAACAAVLMGTLNLNSSNSRQNTSENIEVAMAKVSLPAMTVLTLEHINEEAISRDELPEGQLVSPSRIIGRVLAVPVVEGQVLTESCFVTEGTGALLAASLPHGMRAVTVAVSSKSMPDSILLYPGCVVDVLVCYRLSSRESEGQALSTTMLRGIQVLAVSGDSVVSNPESQEEGGTKRRSNRGTLVTIMVDPKQAEALQLAMENGSISLSLRNPLDRKMFELEGSVLSEGRLARLGSMLTPTVLPTVPNNQVISAEPKQPLSTDNPQVQSINTNNSPQENSITGIFGAKMPVPQPQSINKYPIRQNSRWGVTVIRGRETKLEEFEASEDNEAEKTAVKK